MTTNETKPMYLQQWIDAQLVDDAMRWKGAWRNQMAFTRDVIESLVRCGLPYNARVARVISTHRSKSIILPVVEFARPDLGLRLITRQNFYNWKLSVISERPIDANFDGLFHTTPPRDKDYTGDPLAPVYFEGFPEDLIFGYYDPGGPSKWSAEIWPLKWSAEIWSDEALYTTVFLIMRAVGAIKPIEWTTRETHKAAMAALIAAQDAERERQLREDGDTP